MSSYEQLVARLRRLLLASPKCAAVIIAAALLLRILVPAGFMPSWDHGGVVMTICTGSGPMKMDMSKHGMGQHDDDAAAKSRCAFADLALPLLGGADPIQLAEAIAFVLALGTAAITARAVVAQTWLRPPLRGPPSTL